MMNHRFSARGGRFFTVGTRHPAFVWGALVLAPLILLLVLAVLLVALVATPVVLLGVAAARRFGLPGLRNARRLNRAPAARPKANAGVGPPETIDVEAAVVRHDTL